MSAFMIDDSTIIKLASWSSDDFEEINAIASLLWKANSASVTSRYDDLNTGEAPKVGAVAFARARKVAPVQIVKSADCLSYQSCEYDGWQNSTARLILNAIRGKALVALGLPADDSDTRYMPGYEEAEWG